MEKPLVYLDHNATSPPSKAHLYLLVEKLLQSVGNPSSPHVRGRAASVALTEARKVVAKALGVEAKDLIFVGSGSEANNCATTGVLRQFALPLNEQHVIFSQIEHPSIYEPLEHLQRTEGLRVTQLPVDADGFVSLSELIKNITPDTTFVTLMAANNEIGSLQPVKELGDFLHHMRWGKELSFRDSLSSPGLTGGSRLDPPVKPGDDLASLLHPEVTKETLRRLHFHVDAVQSFGKIKSERWFSDGIDSCALSAHKIGGVQGIGALFLRQGRKFRPLILGGPQEKNRRAGTENLPGAISFGLAARSLLDESWWDLVSQMERRRKMLYGGLQNLPHVVLNSPDANVLPNTVHFSLGDGDINGEDLLVQLDLHGICASSGSACSSGANLPSKVILALNKPVKYAKNSIRLSLSVQTEDSEISNTLKCLENILRTHPS